MNYDSQRGYDYARGMHRYAGNQMALGCLVFMLLIAGFFTIMVLLCAGIIYNSNLPPYTTP